MIQNIRDNASNLSYQSHNDHKSISNITDTNMITTLLKTQCDILQNQN